MKVLILTNSTNYSISRINQVILDYPHIKECLVHDNYIYSLFFSRGIKVEHVAQDCPGVELSCDMMIALINKPIEQCYDIQKIGKQFERQNKQWAYYSV